MIAKRRSQKFTTGKCNNFAFCERIERSGKLLQRSSINFLRLSPLYNQQLNPIQHDWERQSQKFTARKIEQLCFVSDCYCNVTALFNYQLLSNVSAQSTAEFTLSVMCYISETNSRSCTSELLQEHIF